MSKADDGEDAGDYLVLRNGKGQYSLWPSTNDVPAGWDTIDFSGSKQACMSYVDQHWTDMQGPDGKAVRA